MERFIDLIIILSIIVICVGFTWVLSNNPEEESIVNVDCQHEWVVTSSYNWLMQSYRTYSVCSICGQKI